MYNIISSSPTFGKYSADPLTLLESNNCNLKILDSSITANEDKFANALENADALIVGVEKVTERVLSKAENLQIIAKHGAGVDNIDLHAAKRKHIKVANAPGANRHAVADMVFGLFLSIARQIPTSYQAIKDKQWPRIVGNEIYGKTIGVIGTGRIGTEVIKRAQGFRMNVLCYDPFPNEEIEKQELGKYVDFNKLIEQSDLITIHTDLNSRTQSLIGSQELARMKPTAFLINTSRGGIVNEASLIEALINKEIRGAAFDVFEQEPLEDSPFLKLSNFIATPHMAGYTEEALREVGIITVKNILAVLNQKEPEFLV